MTPFFSVMLIPFQESVAFISEPFWINMFIPRTAFSTLSSRDRPLKLSAFRAPGKQILFVFHLDVDKHACRHFQSGQSVHGLLARACDIDESLMSSLLELLSGIFVLMNSSQDRYNLFLGRQRNRSTHLRSCLFYCLDDFSSGLTSFPVTSA